MIFEKRPQKKTDSAKEERILRHVVIDRRDLTAIINAFMARGFEITFYAYRQKVRSLHDIENLYGNNIHEFEISGYSEKFGYVSVQFENSHIRIFSGGSFIASKLQHELAIFLKTRRSLKKQVATSMVWRCVSTVAFMAIFILLFLEPVHGTPPRLLHMYLWMAVALWPLSSAITHFSPTVRHKNWNEKRSQKAVSVGGNPAGECLRHSDHPRYPGFSSGVSPE